jgi:hypothetical protein
MDIKDTSVRIAQVEYGAARPSITKLTSIDFTQDAIDSTAGVTVAIDDAVAIIKEIKLPPESKEQLIEKAQFELRHRLLDPPEQFALETIPTGREQRFIGTAIRHEVGQNRISGTGINYEKNATSWRVRSLALGLGYLNFCSDRSESLSCLVEFSDSIISLCFIYRSGIIALDHIVANGIDLDDETSQRRIIVDLKTLVNYRLSSLFEDGLTLPLSEILFCSPQAEKTLTERLENSFKVSVSIPGLNRGYLAESVDTESIDPIDFLVALGLTVK